jgi:hypothetical protein
MTKRTLGWNPTYFGEPEKGSLASVIADITNKQNDVVGNKPQVQSSAAVQAEEEKQKQLSQEAVNPAQQAAIAISKKEKGEKPKEEEGNAFGKALQAAKDKGEKTFVVSGKKFDVMTKNEIAPIKSKHKPGHKEEDADDMRDKNKKDAKGETPIKVHGEDLNAEIRAAQQGKIKSLVDTIIDTYYTAETNKNDKSDDGDGMDAVQPKAVKKKFANRKDKDIDNDGDVDSSDKFLHKRRKAISKSMGK